jgi:hypothetical protein
LGEEGLDAGEDWGRRKVSIGCERRGVGGEEKRGEEGEGRREERGSTWRAWEGRNERDAGEGRARGDVGVGVRGYE